jgi:peptide chain release factor subunit 1
MSTIEYLHQCKGSGTSLVTLTMKSGSLPSDITKRIVSEMSAASNIKSRVNRNSVTAALRSINQYAKSQKTLPANGVAIFAGQYL